MTDVSAPTEIEVWVCDECGHWRQEERTGVHTAPNPNDPNGRMLTHELRRARYRLVDSSREQQEPQA